MSIKGCAMGLAQEIIALSGMLLLRVPLAVHFARLTSVHIELLGLRQVCQELLAPFRPVRCLIRLVQLAVLRGAAVGVD